MSFSIHKIAAGGIEPLNKQGRNFWVVFSPVDLEIRTNGGEFAVYGQGSGLDNMPDGGTFQRLEIRNPSAGAITVKIYVGGPLYRDARQAIMEPRTVPVGWNGTQIAAGASVTFGGVPTGELIRRKSFQVTNLDAAQNLQIRDANGFVVLTVFPSSNIILPISESVQVHNATGAPIACNISEIYWTL